MTPVGSGHRETFLRQQGVEPSGEVSPVSHCHTHPTHTHPSSNVRVVMDTRGSSPRIVYPRNKSFLAKEVAGAGYERKFQAKTGCVQYVYRVCTVCVQGYRGYNINPQNSLSSVVVKPFSICLQSLVAFTPVSMSYSCPTCPTWHYFCTLCICPQTFVHSSNYILHFIRSLIYYSLETNSIYRKTRYKRQREAGNMKYPGCNGKNAESLTFCWSEERQKPQRHPHAGPPHRSTRSKSRPLRFHTKGHPLSSSSLSIPLSLFRALAELHEGRWTLECRPTRRLTSEERVPAIRSEVWSARVTDDCLWGFRAEGRTDLLSCKHRLRGDHHRLSAETFTAGGREAELGKRVWH